MSKLLLLGPCSNKKNPSKTGGAVVLFENLITKLNESKIQYKLIDTNKKNYSNSLIAYISIVFQIFIYQFGKNHISLHSSRDYIVFSPIILFICKLTNKKCSLRKFGGEAYKTYEDSKGIKRIILNFIFKNVNFLFLEMHYLVKKFKKMNNNTYWFPNVRNIPNINKKYTKFNKKFVFISHVIKEKGIDEIVSVSKNLTNDYTIDIYGPIVDKKYSTDFFKKNNISYKGVLNANDVLNSLSKYDVLLLPSYKEGYPGIVIESYSLGLPIISTKLDGLKEITDEYKTGILIEPKNIKELKKAILYFNEKNYCEMSKNAKIKFKEFNSDIQTKKFLTTIGFNFNA